MSQSSRAERTRLRVSRTLPASRERLFAAWTEPAELRRWWGPRGFTTPSAEIDLRAGGAFRIVMRSAEGKLSLLTGSYLEVTPPERLVYTWQFDGGETTLVTVEFHDRVGATEVVVTHERFGSDEARRAHERGWGLCLDRLDELLSAGPTRRT